MSRRNWPRILPLKSFRRRDGAACFDDERQEMLKRLFIVFRRDRGAQRGDEVRDGINRGRQLTECEHFAGWCVTEVAQQNFGSYRVPGRLDERLQQLLDQLDVR